MIRVSEEWQLVGVEWDGTCRESLCEKLKERKAKNVPY